MWIRAAIHKNNTIKTHILFVFYSCVGAFLGNSIIQIFFSGKIARPETSLESSK